MLRRTPNQLPGAQMMKIGFLLISLLALPLYSPGSEITGLFSSFRMSERSGDIVGMELHLVPDPTGHSIVVHASEGAPAYPETYHVKIDGNEITFSLPETAKCGLPPGDYRARITADALELAAPYNSWVVPRKHSFWQ